MKRLLFIALLALGLLCQPTRLRAQHGRLHILAQTGNACGTTNPQQHCTVLTWAASTTAGVTYNVYRSTTSGGEGTVPLNATAITGLTYTDLVTLTTSQQNFFYYVEAEEAGTSLGTLFSTPTNEVSATFPALPNPAGTLQGVVH